MPGELANSEEEREGRESMCFQFLPVLLPASFSLISGGRDMSPGFFSSFTSTSDLFLVAVARWRWRLMTVCMSGSCFKSEPANTRSRGHPERREEEVRNVEKKVSSRKLATSPAVSECGNSTALFNTSSTRFSIKWLTNRCGL